MTAERYRRLPGRRRGILGGASVWIGSDHLLSVRSQRFRENYKRFYLRDVQAIAVARKPRFHLSMRSLAVGLPLLWTYLILRSQWDWADVVFWSLMLCLVALWAVVSSLFSCTCRIYTAVSRDELPSVYRTWTARRFLAKVEPLIVQAQGALEGDWTEAAEPKGVGPALPLPPPEMGPIRHIGLIESRADLGTGVTSVLTTEPVPATPVNATASYLFIATLLLDAAFNTATIGSQSRAVFLTLMTLMLARVAASINVFVQRYRRRARLGMQKLAIVSLGAMGLFFYIRQVSGQLAAANSPGAYWLSNRLPVLVQIDAAVTVVLALAAVAVHFRSEP